ncbi:hypothetical protein N7478_010161 [Penicillium angulare]|uniref:uncharacterized protein n=1 Tax=Penicillium angulare TaxID=116970 RepID=UPI00253FF61C|nr:uncharacterized protein N7478_010161 [Penicillium angulare]KAJ5267353.1 hypothetical protein N7478_010161 [Penicillium angulare]
MWENPTTLCAISQKIDGSGRNSHNDRRFCLVRTLESRCPKKVAKVVACKFDRNFATSRPSGEEKQSCSIPVVKILLSELMNAVMSTR